ncbi:hypothetical protein Tco_1535270 [Tanacetum coccineum]
MGEKIRRYDAVALKWKQLLRPKIAKFIAVYERVKQRDENGSKLEMPSFNHMLLYSWDGGLDVCVDLTGSSPLTQTGVVDFLPGRAVIDAA